MTSFKFGDVAVTSSDHVALVEFSRPPHNYFDLQLIRDLAEALEFVDGDSNLRAVVLASTGKSFCAGAAFSGSESSADDPGILYREALRLFAASKPIVAAIHGPAIGGGLGLALVADFRIATPEARFAANFVKIGLHPGFGLTHTLPRLVGERRAAAMFYTGDRISGEQAVELGLADELASLDDVRDRALAFAARMAVNAPLAVQATRRTLRANLVEVVRAHTAIEQAEQIRLFGTDDFREGVAAVSERRPGRWRAS